MNLGELRAEYRRQMLDVELPQLWSDADINRYLNEAVNEAAIRARIITDEATDAVCKVDLVADTHTYTLSGKILGISRVKIDGQQKPLSRNSREEMDSEYPGWETQTGDPQIFTELSDGVMRLIPSPWKDGVARLVVWRLPLVAMAADSDVPDIHEKHHFRLIDWARRCGYLKQDSETFDPVAAARYEALFEASFGVRPDANVQRKRRENRSRVVRYGG